MGPREYRGRPSPGCNQCRKKRIKCDEGKPACAKCTRSGLADQCKYRDLVDLAFRSENDFAAQSAKKTWRSRAKKNDARVPDPLCLSSSPAPSASGSSVDLTPEPPMTLDLELCARNRMFYDYTIPITSARMQSGIFDYLPEMFSKASPNSSLHAAIAAVSLANLIRRSDVAVENGRLLVEEKYGNALRIVSGETNDPVTAKSDELLLAVQMLAIFEQMSTGGNNPLFLYAHAHGLAALLKLRPIPSIEDGFRFRLFNTMNMQMLTACLRRGIASFFPHSRLLEYYSAPFPMIKLASIIHRSVDTLAMWKECTSPTSQADVTELREQLAQLSVLDTALADWELMSSLPVLFWISKTPVSSLPSWLQDLASAAGRPEVMYQYDSIQTLYGWNLYRVVRIALCQALLTGSTRLSMVDKEEVFRHIATIESMTEDIRSSVVACFTIPIEGKPCADTVQQICGFRPYTLILPLTVARTCLLKMATSGKASFRLQWVDKVLKFVMLQIHRSKNPPGSW